MAMKFLGTDCSLQCHFPIDGILLNSTDVSDKVTKLQN